MTSPGSFPSSHGKNHPDPKAGRDLDPDKPGCNTSCLGDEGNPTFLCAFFWVLVPDSRLLKPTLESQSQLQWDTPIS